MKDASSDRCFCSEQRKGGKGVAFRVGQTTKTHLINATYEPPLTALLVEATALRPIVYFGLHLVLTTDIDISRRLARLNENHLDIRWKKIMHENWIYRSGVEGIFSFI